jgi:hypothetical protein
MLTEILHLLKELIELVLNSLAITDLLPITLALLKEKEASLVNVPLQLVEETDVLTMFVNHLEPEIL